MRSYWLCSRLHLDGSYTSTFNPLTGTLKRQSNGPLYINMVIGTLAVGGWAVTFGTARRKLSGASARPGPSSLYQMLQHTHQRPVYKLHIIRCGTTIMPLASKGKCRLNITRMLTYFVGCAVCTAELRLARVRYSFLRCTFYYGNNVAYKTICTHTHTKRIHCKLAV